MDIFRYNDIKNRLEVTRQIQPSGCSLGKEEGNGTGERNKKVFNSICKVSRLS